MKKVDFNKLQAGDLVEVPRTQFAPMRSGWNGCPRNADACTFVSPCSMLLSVLICFYGKKISVSEFLRSARSSFLLFPIKKENRQRLYNLLSIFILKLIIFIFIPPSFSALRHKKAPPVGLEPTTLRLTAACSTD